MVTNDSTQTPKRSLAIGTGASGEIGYHRTWNVPNTDLIVAADDPGITSVAGERRELTEPADTDL